MTSNPPLKCDCPCNADGFCLKCHMNTRHSCTCHPTAEPKADNSYPLMQQDGCSDSWCQLPEGHTGAHSDAVCKDGIPFTYHICPTHHTPPVEGEWAERFDREIEHPFLLSENLGSHAPKKIKSFITTLLHSESEKGRAEAVEYINTNLMWARSKDKKSLEIYPEHIAEVLEAAKKNSSLRDKLSTL